MNTHPFFTIRRSYLVYKFSKLRTRALNDAYRSLVTGSKSTLEVFPGSAQHIPPRLKVIGVQDIRVTEIVGTFNRDTDFDSQFRPLKRHSLDRWVNAHILHEQDGWSPILVHKVGERYFVEDGRHRVSVARATGLELIKAEVWEYDVQPKETDACQLFSCCLENRPSEAYITG